MLPPVEDAVLQNNPDFAALYNTLTNVILNPNGSTKNDPAAKEREAIREELKTQRLKTAKRHLLIHAVSTTTPAGPKPGATSRANPPRSEPSTQLPPELFDLLLLLPPLLNSTTPLSAEATTILLSSPPLSLLPELLPDLSALVSSTLQTSAASLARLVSPGTNPSYLHRTIPTITPHITTLQTSLAATQARLTTRRLATATALLALLSTHTAALAALVRALEAKHGAVARSLELRAAEAAQHAQASHVTALAALRRAQEGVYTPEAQGALRAYVAHLQGAEARVREGIRGAAGGLAEYGVGTPEGGDGDEGMERAIREMARVYGQMGRHMREAKRDLERLGRG